MHHIAIPKYALDLWRQRGRSAPGLDRIDPMRTALLVVDMQNAFVSPDAPLTIPYAHEIVEPINRLAKGLRACGGKVCWIQTDFHKERENWSVLFSRRLNSAASASMITSLSPGHSGFELFHELQVAQADLRCLKTRFSPFVSGSSNLDAELRAYNISTVIVTGTVSNTCCESTARDAMMLNYRTIFVSDANAARSDEEHNATLANMLQTFAEVASSAEVIRNLSREEAPNLKTIQQKR
jgi:ureidoacrylate peracid hydrolase